MIAPASRGSLDLPATFFPYRFDLRYAALWVVVGALPHRDGVTVSDDHFRASFGWLHVETARDNVLGGHVTQDYHWYKAVGARLSRADDGLTFGTNSERGVCVHFRERVPRVIGRRPHSALTVTVADCDALLAVIGQHTWEPPEH